MQSTNRRYIPLLDVLRAGAAWWVVLYHAAVYARPVESWLESRNPVMIVLSQGWLAVSIFIMLSGYSLSLGLRGDIDWVAYMKARWLRVAPLYLVILVLALLSTPAVDQPDAGSFFAALSMLPVPDAFAPRPWLQTAWSVKIELVLYLVIPALVYAARRYKPVPLMAMCGALALVMFLALHPTTAVVDILYWGVPGRLVEFAVGFGLGYAGHVFGARTRRGALVAGVVGFLLLAYVANRAGGFETMSGSARVGIYLAALVLGALLLVAVDQRAKPSSSRAVAMVSALGSWSYSTYLWHLAVIRLLVAPLLFEQPTFLGARGSLAAGMLLTVVLVAVLSWASFNLIERPFLSLRPRYVRLPVEATAPVAGRAGAEPDVATGRITRHASARVHGAAPTPRPARHGRPEEVVGAGGRA